MLVPLVSIYECILYVCMSVHRPLTHVYIYTSERRPADVTGYYISFNIIVSDFERGFLLNWLPARALPTFPPLSGHMTCIIATMQK